jgi:hypothetical protein
MKTHWINKTLGWYVSDTGKGFALFNQFGYAGLYGSLESALSADRAMSVEP